MPINVAVGSLPAWFQFVLITQKINKKGASEIKSKQRNTEHREKHTVYFRSLVNWVFSSTRLWTLWWNVAWNLFVYNRQTPPKTVPGIVNVVAVLVIVVIKCRKLLYAMMTPTSSTCRRRRHHHQQHHHSLLCVNPVYIAVQCFLTEGADFMHHWQAIYIANILQQQQHQHQFAESENIGQNNQLCMPAFLN